MKNKAEIEKIISENIRREGIIELSEYLNTSDYYISPASCGHHLAVTGGLAVHSLNVYNVLRELNDRNCNLYTDETIAICGLFHDICKTSFYKIETVWRKDDGGRWENYEKYGVSDGFPAGHGEKSVIILQKYIKLTDDEILAIRWHMGGFTAGLSDYGTMQAFNKASDECVLVPMLFLADYQASHLVERE